MNHWFLTPAPACSNRRDAPIQSRTAKRQQAGWGFMRKRSCRAQTQVQLRQAVLLGNPDKRSRKARPLVQLQGASTSAARLTRDDDDDAERVDHAARSARQVGGLASVTEAGAGNPGKGWRTLQDMFHLNRITT